MNGHNEAVSVESLGQAVDLSAPVLKKNLAHLESAGALEVGADGTLELAQSSLKKVRQTLKREGERERDWDKSRVEMMRLYAEERGCRRHFLLSYSGEDSPQFCGHCNNCAARGEVEVGEAQSADEPLGVGARRASQLGRGSGFELRRRQNHRGF